MEPSPELRGKGEGELGDWNNLDAEKERLQLARKGFELLLDFYKNIDSEFDDLGWDVPGETQRRKVQQYRDLVINNPIYEVISGCSKIFESQLGSLLIARNIIREQRVVNQIAHPIKKDTLLAILSSAQNDPPIRYLRMYTQRVFESGEVISYDLNFAEGERAEYSYGLDHHEQVAGLLASKVQGSQFDILVSGVTRLLGGDLAHFVNVVKRNLKYDRISEKHTQSE